jgi:hypothetical protein
VFVASASACSLLTPLDNLGGDAATEAASDASLDVVTDVAADVVVTDADASQADAGFCPTLEAGQVFCDDFDESDASVFPNWSKLVASNGGAVFRGASDASSPFCAELIVPPNDGGPQAELVKSFISAPTQRVTYAFNLRVVRYPSGNARFNLSPVEFAGSANAGATDFIALTSSGASFTEQFPIDGGGFATVGHPITKGIAANVWVSVRIVWTVGDAGGGTANIFFDGLPVVSQITLDARTVFGLPYMTAGVSYQDPGADGVDLQVDNVVMTLE